MDSVHACLYLSTDAKEVSEAVGMGFPAGQVLPSSVSDDDPTDTQLRVAFDFDGVIVDDEAEQVFQESRDLALFHHYETIHRDKPLRDGPLMPLLKKISFDDQIGHLTPASKNTPSVHIPFEMINKK
jgi:5'-nucleotidase